MTDAKRRVRRTFLDADGEVVGAEDPGAVVCVEHEVAADGTLLVERRYVVAVAGAKD